MCMKNTLRWVVLLPAFRKQELAMMKACGLLLSVLLLPLALLLLLMTRMLLLLLTAASLPGSLFSQY